MTPKTLQESRKYLTTEQEAEYLNVAVQTLHNWRHQRKGPDYIRLGRRKILYEPRALDRYTGDRRVVLN